MLLYWSTQTFVSETPFNANNQQEEQSEADYFPIDTLTSPYLCPYHIIQPLIDTSVMIIYWGGDGAVAFLLNTLS